MVNWHIANLLASHPSLLKEVAKYGGVVKAYDNKAEMCYEFLTRDGQMIKYRYLDEHMATEWTNSTSTTSSASELYRYWNSVVPNSYNSVTQICTPDDVAYDRRPRRSEVKSNTKRKVDVCLCSENLWK